MKTPYVAGDYAIEQDSFPDVSIPSTAFPPQ